MKKDGSLINAKANVNLGNIAKVDAKANVGSNTHVNTHPNVGGTPADRTYHAPSAKLVDVKANVGNVADAHVGVSCFLVRLASY